MKRIEFKRVFNLAIVTAILAVAVAGCAGSQKVGASEKALFLTAQDLVPYGFDFQPISKHETFEKTKNFDGSYELRYEFETPETEQKSPLFLYETIALEQKVSDALLSQGSERIGLLVGLKSSGVTEQSVKNAKTYGDSSSLTLLVSEGKPIGNCFTMRKGKRVYLLLMTGLYFDDPADWDEMIQPKLKQLFAYNP